MMIIVIVILTHKAYLVR